MNDDEIVVILLFLVAFFILYLLIKAQERRQQKKNEEALMAQKLDKFSGKLSKLSNISKKELIDLPEEKFKDYLEIILIWRDYKVSGGGKELSDYQIPVSDNLWNELLGCINEVIDLGDSNLMAMSFYVKESLQGTVDYAVNTFYEYGLPEGFESNKILYMITFTRGFCNFITFEGVSYKMLASNIIQTSISTSRGKVRLRLKVNDPALGGEVTIFDRYNENPDSSISFLDWVNKRIQEQKSYIKNNISLRKLNKKKIQSDLNRVKSLNSKRDKLIQLHAILEHSLKEATGIKDENFSSLLDKAYRIGIYDNIDGLHQARQSRNSLAHGGTIIETHIANAVRVYEGSIIRLLKL